MFFPDTFVLWDKQKSPMPSPTPSKKWDCPVQIIVEDFDAKINNNNDSDEGK